MGNLKNFNFNKIDAYLTSSEYYDFILNQDGEYYGNSLSDISNVVLTGACLIVHYDFNNSLIFNDVLSSGFTSGFTSGSTFDSNMGNTITSLTNWVGYTNTGLTLDTFGLTGLDNGYINFSGFSSSDPTNNTLINSLTGTTVSIPSTNKELILNAVTGYTGSVTYPTSLNYYDKVGLSVDLCGGFYQGYYKLDGYNYEILPNRHPKGFVTEFWLNKNNSNCSGFTGTTLNDLHPNNKGFFFYMGARAENKYWNFFEGLNTGCTSGCTDTFTGCTDTLTDFCTPIKERDVYIESDFEFPISLSPRYFESTKITNKFLIYGRASKLSGCTSCGEPSGLGNETICSYTGQTISFSSDTRPLTYDTNPFLVYGRASKLSGCTSCGEPSGLGNETICSYTGQTSQEQNKDVNVDVIDNALGFRIKDDGSIGYRLLTVSGSCTSNTYVSGVTVEEGYSLSGAVKDNEWTHVAIRHVMPDEFDECQLKVEGSRTGKLMFYINGYLKYVVNDFDEFIPRRLDEYKEKQLGVPFNISLGGGSQGLMESLTFDSQDPDDLGLSIEKNFAGSFVGSISQFRFYGCDLNWCEIKNNYFSEIKRYD